MPELLLPCKAGEVPDDNDWLDDFMEAEGGDRAARWSAFRAKTREWTAQTEARSAELDALPLNEVRGKTIGALDMAVDVLSNTQIDAALRAHGWSEDFAQGLAEECRSLRSHVEDGTYKKDWGGAGLGRWMLEEVSGKTDDILKKAVHEADFMLSAFSRHLPQLPDPSE